MTKILSRSGDSLADMYDIEGSIAGLEQLETKELPIVHEMGATIFSERLRTRIFRITTGGIDQSIVFNIEEVNLPDTPTRLFGVQVIVNGGARIARCAVLATDPTLGQDIPLWVFDATLGEFEETDLEDAGVAVTRDVLVPRTGLNVFPAFVGGSGQGPADTMVSSITLAGETTAFGAGTVVITALLYLAFPARDINISSRGLPIPSW